MAIREIIILPDKQLRLVSRPIEKVTAEVRKLADDIRLNPGVDAAALSDFRDGSAEILVTTEDIPGGDLAAMILRNKALGLVAVSATAYAVELKKP